MTKSTFHIPLLRKIRFSFFNSFFFPLSIFIAHLQQTLLWKKYFGNNNDDFRFGLIHQHFNEKDLDTNSNNI